MSTINNLLDLSVVLNNLKHSQLTGEYKIISNGECNQQIKRVEVTTEPFLEHEHHGDDFGYESELRRKHGDQFDRSKYNVKEKTGFVILYTE